MTVNVSIDDRSIATVVFTAPPLNLYDAALHEEFDSAFSTLEASNPRAVVLRAEGRVVTGGVNVAEFNARTSISETKALYDRMFELTDQVLKLRMPVIFVCHGLTLTWALEIALASDLIIAGRSASFGLVERVIGLTPTMGGTQRLASRAGIGRAKQIVLTGSRFDAETFERWNIVNEVVADEDLDARVDALAADLASGPTKAFGALKDVMDLYADASVGAVDREITSIAAQLFETVDLRHGMESFLTDGPGKATFIGS